MNRWIGAEMFLYQCVVLRVARHAIATIGAHGVGTGGCEVWTDVLCSRSSIEAFVDIYGNESKRL